MRQRERKTTTCWKSINNLTDRVNFLGTVNWSFSVGLNKRVLYMLRARFVLGWTTVSPCNQPLRSTQPGHPLMVRCSECDRKLWRKQHRNARSRKLFSGWWLQKCIIMQISLKSEFSCFSICIWCNDASLGCQGDKLYMLYTSMVRPIVEWIFNLQFVWDTWKWNYGGSCLRWS